MNASEALLSAYFEHKCLIGRVNESVALNRVRKCITTSLTYAQEGLCLFNKVQPTLLLREMQIDASAVIKLGVS